MAVRFASPAVALLAGARQHGSEPGLTGVGKVGPSSRGCSVIGRRSRGSGPIEESQHMPLGAGVPSLRLVVSFAWPGGRVRTLEKTIHQKKP